MQSTWLLHLSNVIYAFGFSIKDMLWLRVSIIAGCAVEIVYRLHSSADSLWGDVPWCSLYIALNAVQVGRLVRNRHLSNFTDEERQVYRTTFSDFTPGDFRRLLQVAEWECFEEGEKMVSEGVELQRLIYVVEGGANVKCHEQHIARLRSGSFAGEMSFLTGNPTSADVIAASKMRCLVWQKKALKELMEKNEDIEAVLRVVFNTDLIGKLAWNRPATLPVVAQ